MNPNQKNGYTLIELIATIMIVAIIGAMCVGGLQSCSSSTGSRVGQIVKLSNKGLVAKTWEGDLTTGGLTANGVNVWHFSVSDEQLIPALQSAMDQNRTVKLAYSQKMFRSPLTGDTSYFVTSVTVITNK